MKIGKAVFKQGATNRHMTAQIQSLISNENFWAIDHKRYQKQNWSLIFAEIEQIAVSTLILDYNSHRTIVAEISHVRFYHMKELWLRQNKISSIEDLASIEAPFLQLLRISMYQVRQGMNYIVKFKPLVKMQSPANPLYDFPLVVRTHFNSEMKDIFLQYWSHNNVIAEDLSFVVKFNVRSFHDLWVKGNDRIDQPVVRRKIKNKFARLNLYVNEQQDQDD